MTKRTITEKDKVHEEWYERAKKMTVEGLPEFVRELTEDYGHDYGTICHACAAAALAALYAVVHSPSGGITGFQAGAVEWEFIKRWGAIGNPKNPMQLIDMGDLLYPQYESKFGSITADTWKWLQGEATKKLAGPDGVDRVRAHWQLIAAGNSPFGLAVAE